MAMVSVGWWCVPHRFQLEKAKNLNLPIVCFQHWAQEMFKNCWVCDLMMVCTVISKA